VAGAASAEQILVFTAAAIVALWANVVIIILGAVFLWLGDWSSLERKATPASEDSVDS
jgi:hypothetical protein